MYSAQMRTGGRLCSLVSFIFQKQPNGTFDETHFPVRSKKIHRPEDHLESFDLDDNNLTTGSLNVPENELSLEIKVDQISSKYVH